MQILHCSVLYFKHGRLLLAVMIVNYITASLLNCAMLRVPVLQEQKHACEQHLSHKPNRQATVPPEHSAA